MEFKKKKKESLHFYNINVLTFDFTEQKKKIKKNDFFIKVYKEGKREIFI